MSAGTRVLQAPDAAAVRASRDRVDVWQVSLEAPASETARETLDEAERAYAARLRVGAARWVAARAALRRVLGRYLGLSPADVALESGANGKPRLAPGAACDLRFNLSHSGGVALIAVRLGSEVGIDVEQIRPGVDAAAIAREVFSDMQSAAVPARGVRGDGVDFFGAWARREALAKATGRGILEPATPGEGAGHAVRDLPFHAGYAAALASEGRAWSVRWLLA